MQKSSKRLQGYNDSDEIYDPVHNDVYRTRPLFLDSVDAQGPGGSGSGVRGEKSAAYTFEDSSRATRRKPGGRLGCLPALLLVLLVAVFIAWHLGYIDRWFYEQSLVRAGEQAVSMSISANSTAAESVQAGEGSSAAENALLAPSASQAPVPYVYSQLNEEDRGKYNLVLTALVTREEQPYPEASMEDLQRIYQCVQADHPELFYVDGATMETVTNRASGMVERVSVKGRFAYTPQDASDIESRLEAAANACLAGLPEGSDDYAKAKYVYEWLATHVSYDSATAAGVVFGSNEEEGHNASRTIEGPLLWGSAVCGGYAGTFQYLMQRMGVQSAFVIGLGDGGAHAWCLAQLDGDYYYVDPTWSDPQSEGTGGELGYVNYDYLNVTTSDLTRTHAFEGGFPLPNCTATRDNYYVREGLEFDTADTQRLGALVASAFAQGRQVQVRCTDEGVYRELLDGFVFNGRLGAYLPDGTYRYTFSDPNLSIVVLPA